MKKNVQSIVILMIMAVMLITSCSTGGNSWSSDPSAEITCEEGVCAEINIGQPIVLNQPADITITIRSTVDYPNLSIALHAVPSNVIFGPDSNWSYDAIANQSKEFHSEVTFTSEGEYQVGAMVFTVGGLLLSNEERILITKDGVVINPTINPNPTSDLFLPSTPQPEAMTATAQAEVTPTPLPPVEGFTPQEWLEKCGWSVEQLQTLKEWPGISGWLKISETSVIGEQLNGTLSVGFKDEANPDVTIQARIGLCTIGQGWTTDGTHEWNATLRSGTPFEAPVSVSFTQTGDIPIFIVVLDTQNNRIAGIGRLIAVLP